MSVIDLLSTVPNIDAFWEKNGAALTTLGIAKSDIDSVETLLEIKMILLALNGDIAANKYLDQKKAAERWNRPQGKAPTKNKK